MALQALGRAALRPASIATERTKERVVVADAFRAIAILLVVANHIGMSSQLTIAGEADDLAYLGAWGVDAFFVLSGFLLTPRYLAAIVRGDALPSMKQFFARRFFRIYPLYAVAVLASALVAAINDPDHVFPRIAVLTHLTFTQGFVPDHAFSLNAPLWTMAVDAQFYLLLPFVALGLAVVARRVAPPRRAALIAGALVAIMAASLVYRWIVVTQFDLRVVGDGVAATFVLARNVLGMGFAFALGALIALAQRVRPAPSRFAVGTGLAVGIAAFFALAACGRSMVDTPEYAIGYDALGALSAAALLYALGRDDGTGRSRLRLGLLIPFAPLAYAVYLFHILVLHAVGEPFAAVASLATGTPGYVIAVTVLTLGVSLAIAVPAHGRIERPFLTIRDQNR